MVGFICSLCWHKSTSFFLTQWSTFLFLDVPTLKLRIIIVVIIIIIIILIYCYYCYYYCYYYYYYYFANGPTQNNYLNCSYKKKLSFLCPILRYYMSMPAVHFLLQLDSGILLLEDVFLSDSNGIRPHNYLVHKRTLN